MGKSKKPKEAPKADTPDFLLDLDTVYVRTSKTQLNVQPKADLINEPPSMNMAMTIDPVTGKQLFTVHYKKPVVPPDRADAHTQTDKPRLLHIAPAEIIARYSCVTQEDEDLPVLVSVPQEGKYVVDAEAKILKYNQTHLGDSDESVSEDSDEEQTSTIMDTGDE